MQSSLSKKNNRSIVMSNNVEAPHLEVVEEEPSLTKDEVINVLIAIGVNTCNRSYDTEHKGLKNSFLEMPLSDIAKSWDHLEDAVKISIINSHAEEFKAWINGRK
jgi:hypothetical protein